MSGTKDKKENDKKENDKKRQRNSLDEVDFILEKQIDEDIEDMEEYLVEGFQSN